MMLGISCVPHGPQGARKYKVVGALQVCLDIECAFDMVSREQLFCRLGGLGINPQIVLLLSPWHQQTHYHLNCNGEDTPIQVGRGVRQGCRAAPLLWNGYMIYVAFLDGTIVRCINVYADDYQMGDIFTSLIELAQLLHNVTVTLQLLTKFRLNINPAKCTALLTMGGTAYRRLRTGLTSWRDGKEWLVLHGDTTTFWLPIATQAKYLGTVISYKKMEGLTMHHRVQLSRIAFGRLRGWLTGKRGLCRARRIHLFSTCVYPILTYGIFPLALRNIA